MNFQRRKRQSTAAWIKLILYIVMLLMVGASMRMIISEEAREYLKNFFTGQNSRTQLEAQKMNWCPADLTKIIIVANNKEITGADELSRLCETASEPYEVTDLEKITFQPFLLAISAENQKLSLEVGSVPGFFRIGDLPFRSLGLQKEISKYR